MKTNDVGASQATPEAAAPAAAGTPGKQTLAETSGGELGGGEHLLNGPQKLEGATLYAGPDDALQATEPPAPAKTSDDDYENTMGVKKAIADGKMTPVAGVNGQSFTAVGCAGQPAGKVTFTFDRAYVGDYAYAAAGGKAVRGVSVAISAKLDGCGTHTDVKLVQVLRNITKKAGKIETADPDSAKRKERAGWNDAGAKSKGWFVDGLDTDTSPFYVSDEFYGSHGSSASPAKLRDSPGMWATSKNIGREFRTCAVSYAGGKGTVLACVDWGYYIDDAGNASFYPAKPTASVGAIPEVTDAAKRWDALPGLDKANLS